MKRRGRVLTALAVSMAWLAGTRHAIAQGDHPVAVQVDGCEGLLPQGALEGALGVELRGADERVTEYIRRVRPHARVRCENNELVIELTADEGVAYRESAGTIRVGIPRFLAIAIVEALEAQASRPTQTEPATPPPTPAPTPTPTPAPIPPPPTTTSSRSIYPWIGVRGGFQWGGSPAFFRGHGGLQLELQSGTWWGLHAGFGFYMGSIDAPLGLVQAIEGSMHLGFRFGFSRGPLRVELGPGVRGGFVHWTGTPVDGLGLQGLRGMAPWMGAMADLQVGLAVTRSLRFTVFLEGGVPIASASATAFGSTVARLDPAWLLGGLGLAIRLPP